MVGINETTIEGVFMSGKNEKNSQGTKEKSVEEYNTM